MDQARRRAERVSRMHSFRQRLSSTRIPPSVGREEEIAVTGWPPQAGTRARRMPLARRRRTRPVLSRTGQYLRGGRPKTLIRVTGRLA
jgi:hypothetical protein